MEEVMVDKLGQEIEVGQWVIKPWQGSFDIGRVVKVTNSTFTYEYEIEGGRMASSVCKVPWRCIVVPEIVANYWNVLK